MMSGNSRRGINKADNWRIIHSHFYRLLCNAVGTLPYYTIFERAFATRKSNLPLGGATTRLMSLPSFRVKARSYFDPIICYIAQASVFSPCLVTLLSSGLFTDTQWSTFLFWIFKIKYRTRAIITRGLYSFYPLFEAQKRFFKGLFS